MSGAPSPLDLVLVAAIVGAALSFLIYRLIKPAPPACHTLARKSTSEDAPVVILGASLEKGLKRAQAKRQAKAPTKAHAHVS